MVKKITIIIIVFFLICWAISCSKAKDLSIQEKEYLQNNDSIKVALYPYYPPYQFINGQGKMDGIYVDFLELIEKKIDYKFKEVYYNDWSQLIKDIRNNKVDIILEIQKSNERENFLTFYQPLFESKNALVQKKGTKLFKNLDDLGNKKIVLPENYYTIEVLKKKYPKLNIFNAKDDFECLKKVSEGQYEATIIPKTIVRYLINNNACLNQLTIATDIDLIYKPGIAVNKKNVLLNSIMNKAYRNITQEEKNNILDNWLFNVVTPIYSKPNFWILISSCVVCLLIIIVLLNRFLNYRIHLKTEELRIAKEKAEESDRLKTNFIQNISHEIRTPMNGIIGFSELLMNGNLTAEEQKEYAKIISNNSKDLIVSIDNILEIAKLHTEIISIRPEEIDLDVLFQNINKKYNQKASEKNIRLIIEKMIDEKNTLILIDKPKLFKILINLVDNAIKFTDQGSVIIKYEIVGDNVIITIKDSGIGIKTKDQGNIFNSFSQSEKEISKNYGGLGLGLSIAKKNADLIGGTITFITKENQGSTFTLKIPFIPVIKKIDAKSGNEEVKNEKPEKQIILIAEDGDVNFLFLKTILTKMPGFDFLIHRAENGKKAVEICQGNDKIDLVLMDIKMPIMDGYEATKLIKKLRPNLPVVAQTAYSTEDDIQKAIAAGCDDFIAKPVDTSLLNHILSRFIVKET
jgi:signal transduction histidine kinase/CheY-like chemotaxis protein